MRAINAMRPAPAFVIVCGDLVNAFPAQPDMQAAQVRQDLGEPYPALTASLRLSNGLFRLQSNNEIYVAFWPAS